MVTQAQDQKQPLETQPRVGIVGAGLMGISLGYFLTRLGMQVEIYEASSALGGLAGSVCLGDGTAVDRFYHAILSSDTHLRSLCLELGIADQLRFHETKMGFYYQGAIHPMNNMVDFLRFPPLGWIDRFRLGLTIIAAQFIRDWRSLEAVSVEKWLLAWSGKRTFQNIWKPMLNAKFDGGFDGTPATYIWSRLVRVKSTRRGASQKEEAGHLIGGYQTLINAMAAAIEKAGGHIYVDQPAKEIVIDSERASGIRIGDEIRPFQAVVATTPVPVFQKLIPHAGSEYQAFLNKTDYLGIVAPLLVLDRPLSGYWTLNITDETLPFTGVIETTSFIDPQYVGGHHLVYLPKYTAPASVLQTKTDEEIKEMWLSNIEKMFPQFDRRWIRFFVIQRERYIEPLHGLSAAHLIPEIGTPIQGLFLATTAQIYPALTNGESVSQHAHQAAELIAKEIRRKHHEPAHS